MQRPEGGEVRERAREEKRVKQEEVGRGSVRNREGGVRRAWGWRELPEGQWVRRWS